MMPQKSTLIRINIIVILRPTIDTYEKRVFQPQLQDGKQIKEAEQQTEAGKAAL